MVAEVGASVPSATWAYPARVTPEERAWRRARYVELRGTVPNALQALHDELGGVVRMSTLKKQVREEQ